MTCASGCHCPGGCASERVAELEAALAEAQDGWFRCRQELYLPVGAEADLALALKALRAVEAHHVGMNEAGGRPLTNSTTLRIVRAALAGCDHLAGDVCRKCHPSVPFCAVHPDAPVRRFGPLFRCNECGEPGCERGGTTR